MKILVGLISYPTYSAAFIPLRMCSDFINKYSFTLVKQQTNIVLSKF
jgi:hypothetical protein